MSTGGQLAIHVGGPGVTVPVPPEVIDAVQQVSVTLDDAGKSGFQITLELSRPRGAGNRDYPVVSSQALRIGNRVQITARLGDRQHPLMDGIVTNHQTAPSNEPGASTLTVSGEDLTVLLDQHAVQIEIDRSLYMDEAEIVPNANFAALQELLRGVIAEIAAIGCAQLPMAAE